MKVRIVVDSSADLKTNLSQDLISVPLKIRSGEKEFVDDDNLDPIMMINELEKSKEKDSTSCPNVQEWLDAFGDSQYIIGITITSHLSGSYNAAKIAADEYMEENPGTKVHIIDSLSAGPELMLIAEKVRELAQEHEDFDTISILADEYAQKKSRLLFMLGSLANLAKNGRVNPAVAKIAGVLNIKIVGEASEEGELAIMNKCRGENRAIAQLWENMKKQGFKGGKVRIRHTMNPLIAETLKKLILGEFPLCDIMIGFSKGLCSYYAQLGGVLVGFEIGT